MKQLTINTGDWTKSYHLDRPECNTADEYLIEVVLNDREYWSTVKWSTVEEEHDERLYEARCHRTLLNLHWMAYGF